MRPLEMKCEANSFFHKTFCRGHLSSSFDDPSSLIVVMSFSQRSTKYYLIRNDPKRKTVSGRGGKTAKNHDGKVFV